MVAHEIIRATNLGLTTLACGTDIHNSQSMRGAHKYCCSVAALIKAYRYCTEHTLLRSQT